MKDLSPTICILPWASVSIGTSGQVLRCQMSPEWMGHLGENRLDEILDNPKYQRLRNKMRQGEWDLPYPGDGIKRPGCLSCNQREQMSLRSKRKHWQELQFVEDLWNTPGFFDGPPQNIYHLDIAFNSLCNFKCRMCNSVYSTKWAADEAFLQKNNFTNRNLLPEENYPDFNIVDRLREISPRLKTLRRIELVGGEPFINPHFEPFLEFLDELGIKSNCEFMVTTNGSKITQRLLDKIKGFKYVNLNISIDATGHLFEYMRSAGETSWEEIQANVDLAIKYCRQQREETNNIWKVNLNSSFQTYNMLNLYEFISWIIQTLGLNAGISNPGKNRHSFEYRLLLYPRYLSAEYAPQKMKQECLNQLNRLLEEYPWLTRVNEAKFFPDVKNLITREQEDPQYAQKMAEQFRTFTVLLDEKREQQEISFLKTLHEYT